MTRFSIRSLALLLLVAVGTPSLAAAAPDTTAARVTSAGVAGNDSLGTETDSTVIDSKPPAAAVPTATTIDSVATQLDKLYAARDANQTFIERWLRPIGTGLGALVLLGALSFLFWRQQQMETRSAPTHIDPYRPQGSSTAAPIGILNAKSEIEQLRETVTRLEDKVHRLSGRVVGLEQPSTPQYQPAPTPTATIVPPVPPTAGPQSADQKLAAGFVKWCRERGPLASKMDMFANYVATAMPGATVEHVYRDLDSTVRPLRFGTNPGNAPADYWVVHVEGQSLLLPMPLGPAQFKDLNPAFEGSAVPATLQTFVPARVQNEGGQYALVQPGRIG